MKFKSKVLLILLALSLLFTACSNNSTPAEVAEDSEKNNVEAENVNTTEKTFAVVFPIVHPFFEPIGVDAENYGKQNGWNVITNAPSSSNAQEQVEIMENLIAMKVDGIAIGPTDPSALVQTINKAVDSGIKVISFETDAPDSKSMAYIGTDNYKAGRHMGAVITEKLNGEGEIVILTGLPTQLSLNERIRGIEEYLKENSPGITIVDKQSSEGDAGKAVDATENMIKVNPNFKALIGIDATAGPAAVSVWKAKGWQNSDEHMIITFDDMPANLDGLRDGYIKSIVAQRQTSWGVATLQMLNDLTEGKDVEKYVDTGSIEITLDNIDTYAGEPSYVEK